MRGRLAPGSVAHRLARGAGWSLVGSLSSQALALLSTIVVARYVGVVGFGEIGMVQSTLGVFGILAGFGLGATTAKYVAEFRLTAPRRAAGIMALTTIAAIGGGAVMASACFAVAPLLSASVLNSEALVPLLRAGALLLFVSTLNGVQAAALSGFEAFRAVAKINVVQGFATPAVTIPCVWAFGVAGAVAAMTIVACIGLILCTVALNAQAERHGMVRDLRNVAWSEWPILWKFALPSMFSALMVAPVMWITNAMLVARPDGYGELGLFNAANQWRALILYVPAALGPALMPILSETYGREDREDFRSAVALSLKVAWVCALPLTIVVLGWSQPLASLFGRQFDAAGAMIPILAIACFITVVTGTVGTALASSARMWTGFSMNVAWAVALASLGLAAYDAERPTTDVRQQLSPWEWQAAAIGAWLGQSFAAQQPLVAVDAAGGVPFFSRLPSLDMMGLCDATIARTPVATDRVFIVGHNRGNGAYVLARRPDVVLFTIPGIDPIPRWKSGVEMIADPSFFADYRLVQCETGMQELGGGTRANVPVVPWLRLEGRIGVQREAARVIVPGYLLGSFRQSYPLHSAAEGFAWLQDGAVVGVWDASSARVVGEVRRPGRHVLSGLQLAAGTWTAHADGAPAGVSFAVTFPSPDMADLAVEVPDRVPLPFRLATVVLQRSE